MNLFHDIQWWQIGSSEFVMVGVFPLQVLCSRNKNAMYIQALITNFTKARFEWNSWANLLKPSKIFERN